MANARGIVFREKLSDLSECSICAETFTNPKILPCVHTFCLHCLEKYGMHKKPGNPMNCPLCKNEFIIPGKGLSELPNNFFIGKIVEIGKLATAPAKDAVCEVCSDKTMVANAYCIECEQKLCDRCGNSHTKIKHCQNHRVVDLRSQLNFKELKLCNSYCEHHPNELIKMYCHNDNVAICLICCVESHQSHKCSNVDKAAGQFAEQLKDDLRKVTNRRPECEEAFKKLEKFKIEFASEVLTTEENIRKSGTELKTLIDQHTEILVQNLRVARDRNLKCFETTKQDVDRFRVMIDSYQRYCDELIARGTPVDICRAANQMHKRATELEKQSANCNVGDFICDKIAFRRADVEALMKKSRISNIVGELPVTKSTDRIIKFQKRTSGNDVPINWVKMTNGEELKIIQLRANDQEYQDVENAFWSTSQNTVNRIVTIQRIQNKQLYNQYVARKAVMDAANPGVQNEMTLWYGTDEDSLESINRPGFNSSNCRTNEVHTRFSRAKFQSHPKSFVHEDQEALDQDQEGDEEEDQDSDTESYGHTALTNRSPFHTIAGHYGTGIYFAKNFSYAARNMYLRPCRSGLKYVYQCKVLTGEYGQSHVGILHLNMMMTAGLFPPTSNSRKIDSTVDNVANPNIFVINCDSQAYPEYLIHFQ